MSLFAQCFSNFGHKNHPLFSNFYCQQCIKDNLEDPYGQICVSIVETWFSIQYQIENCLEIRPALYNALLPPCHQFFWRFLRDPFLWLLQIGFNCSNNVIVVFVSTTSFWSSMVRSKMQKTSQNDHDWLVFG